MWGMYNILCPISDRFKSIYHLQLVSFMVSFIYMSYGTERVNQITRRVRRRFVLPGEMRCRYSITALSDLSEEPSGNARVITPRKTGFLFLQETVVSRHNGGQIKNPLQNPQYDTAFMVRGVSRDCELGSHDAENHQSYGQLHISVCADKTIYPFPFTLNGI